MFGTSKKAMSNCELYQLVETRAPDGYAEAEPKWIMLKGNAEDDVIIRLRSKKQSDRCGGAEIVDDANGDDRRSGSTTTV